MNILKKDEKFFEKNMGHTKLTQYYKTKDNSLRIAIFENNEFVAFETSKANNAIIKIPGSKLNADKILLFIHLTFLLIQSDQ